MSDSPSTEARATLVATLRSAQSPWMHQAANEIEALAVDLAALRIEHARNVELLAAARREREEARDHVDQYTAIHARMRTLLGGAEGEPIAVENMARDVVRERDELRARLDNERGRGSGPSPSWRYRRDEMGDIGEWYRPGASVWTYEGSWCWGVGSRGVFTGVAGQPENQTAREAMRAADAALAGSGS